MRLSRLTGVRTEEGGERDRLSLQESKKGKQAQAVLLQAVHSQMAYWPMVLGGYRLSDTPQDFLLHVVSTTPTVSLRTGQAAGSEGRPAMVVELSSVNV